MLMLAKLPHEEFNDTVRDGSNGEKMRKIIEAAKPEAVYFSEFDGQRTALMVVDMKDPSDVPAYAEPWFLTFNADVEFRVAMTPADLEKAGLDNLAKEWA